MLGQIGFRALFDPQIITRTGRTGEWKAGSMSGCAGIRVTSRPDGVSGRVKPIFGSRRYSGLRKAVLPLPVTPDDPVAGGC